MDRVEALGAHTDGSEEARETLAQGSERPAVSLHRGLLRFTFVLMGATFVVALTLALITTSMHRASDRLWNAKTSVRAAQQVEIGLLLHERMSLLGGITGERRYEEARQAAAERLVSGLDIEDRQPHETEVPLRTAIDDYFTRREVLAQTDADPLEQYMALSPEVETAVVASEAFINGARGRAHAARALTERWNSVADAVALLVSVALIVLAVLAVLGLRRMYRAFEAVRVAIGAFGHAAHEVRAPEVGPKELRDIAVRFNLMADRLAHQRETQVRFISAVAHDLRTPLGALKLATSMALARPHEAPEKSKRALELVGRQAERLESLVCDLIEVSRAEAGRIPLRLGHCDLGALVREAVALFSSSTNGHALRVSLPDEPLIVCCDAHRMSQVLDNLLSNAIKYSPEGGRVELSVRRDQAEAVMVVSDEGVGIDEERQEEIFDPFARLPETAERVPGIGMGLWITKRIVEAHEGRIEVRSSQGQGASFLVRLPVAGPKQHG